MQPGTMEWERGKEAKRKKMDLGFVLMEVKDCPNGPDLVHRAIQGLGGYYFLTGVPTRNLYVQLWKNYIIKSSATCSYCWLICFSSQCPRSNPELCKMVLENLNSSTRQLIKAHSILEQWDTLAIPEIERKQKDMLAELAAINNTTIENDVTKLTA